MIIFMMESSLSKRGTVPRRRELSLSRMGTVPMRKAFFMSFNSRVVVILSLIV